MAGMCEIHRYLFGGLYALEEPRLKPRPFLCFLEPTLHGRSRCFALHFSASDDFQNHPVAVKNQHSVSAGIAAFGSVLCFAFGSDADTAETCGLESRSDQRQVAALGYIYLLFHSVSC